MLEVKNLTVSFTTRNGKNTAVSDVSFQLEAGKTLGIVGESGSGKSITCYSLLGLVPSPPGQIDNGEVWYNTSNLLTIPESALRRIRGAEISMIFQDPMTSLNPYMRVGDQIAEAINLHQHLTKAELNEKVIRALEEVGIDAAKHRIKSYPHEFSGGMRQRVMIAMALATEPKILMADEPTTALDVTIQAQILQLLADIQKKRQLSIIFISHDLAVVKNIADDVVVMKDGHIVERGKPEALFAHPQHAYTKKLIDAIPTTSKPPAYRQCQGETLLEIDALYTVFKYHSGSLWNRQERQLIACNNISLDIKKGEIFGLVGESGSGKSTLGRTILRLVEGNSGKIIFNGNDLLTANKNQIKALRSEMQMIFQDPYASLNPRMTVYDALAEPLLTHQSKIKKGLDERVNQLLDEVGLERMAARKYPHEFSGGQRQRIAIARALACEPKFIVADEPVSALDVTIQAQILDLLLNLSKTHNLTMLFISHDLAVVRYLCDRVAVMRAGEIVEVNTCDALFDTPKHRYTQQLLAAIPN